MERVRFDFDSGSADVVTEDNKRLRRVDRFRDDSRIGIVIAFVAANPDAFDFGVGESLADFHAFRLSKSGLNSMFVSRAKFNAQATRLGTIRNQRRQIPVLAPLVSDQPKLDVRTLLLFLSNADAWLSKRRQ
jgi:hypothetical protein